MRDDKATDNRIAPVGIVENRMANVQERVN